MSDIKRPRFGVIEGGKAETEEHTPAERAIRALEKYFAEVNKTIQPLDAELVDHIQALAFRYERKINEGNSKFNDAYASARNNFVDAYGKDISHIVLSEIEGVAPYNFELTNDEKDHISFIVDACVMHIQFREATKGAEHAIVGEKQRQLLHNCIESFVHLQKVPAEKKRLWEGVYAQTCNNVRDMYPDLAAGIVAIIEKEAVRPI